MEVEAVRGGAAPSYGEIPCMDIKADPDLLLELPILLRFHLEGQTEATLFLLMLDLQAGQPTTTTTTTMRELLLAPTRLKEKERTACT